MNQPFLRANDVALPAISQGGYPNPQTPEKCPFPFVEGGFGKTETSTENVVSSSCPFFSELLSI